jgi:CheY-like chemotaxis protein
MDGQHGRPWRILVVDDDTLQLGFLEALLEECGCHVLPASCLSEAVRLMDGDAKPQAALVDYRLHKGETGLMVIQELRQRCGYDVPVLILTAERSPDTLQRITASGVPFVNKPVDETWLCAKVAELRAGSGWSVGGDETASVVTAA